MRVLNIISSFALASVAAAGPVQLAERQAQKLRISKFRLQPPDVICLQLTQTKSAPGRQHHRDRMLARLRLGHDRRGRVRRPGAVRGFTEQQPAGLPAQHSQLGPAPRGALGLAGHRHRQQPPGELAAEHAGRHCPVHAGHQRRLPGPQHRRHHCRLHQDGADHARREPEDEDHCEEDPLPPLA